MGFDSAFKGLISACMDSPCSFRVTTALRPAVHPHFNREASYKWKSGAVG